MLSYAESGEEPTINGSERFVWPMAKKELDKQAETFAKRSEANRKNVSVRWDTKEYETIRNDTKKYDSYNSYKLVSVGINSYDQEKGEEIKQDLPPERKKEPKKEITPIEKNKEDPKRTIPPNPPAPDSPDIEGMFGYNQHLLEAVQDWLAYKKERRQGYKGTGLRNLLSTIQNRVSEYGEDAVVSLIRESMAQNYQGITWDKLKRNARNNSNNDKTNNIFMQIYEERWGENGSSAVGENPFGP